MSGAACTNCAWRPARATTTLCAACYDYQRRTGRPRPLELILRHLHRTTDREILDRHPA